jgi:hypothetical protein
LQCEEAEKYLFEFSDGGLTDLERKAVDQHIQQCEPCAALLNDIWETELQSANWRDLPAPNWEKRSLFFGSPAYRLPWLNLAGISVTALLLVVVLSRVEVTSSDNGLSVSFAGQNDLVSSQEFERRLSMLQEDTERSFNVNAEQLTSQQVATNQLLLRAILDTSRQERREDLGNMMVLWDTDRQQRNQMTEESLRYLIRSQAEDKRELRDLSQVLRGYDNQQDENL